MALLADTVHNFSDALTAVPLWVAFLLGRRKATRTYTYGFGRAEDLAGLGFPLTDPIVVLISAAIVVLLWGTMRDVGRRLMDGVDTGLADRLAAVVDEHSRNGGTSRLRWSGHRLHAEITVPIGEDASLVKLASLTTSLEEGARKALPHLGSVTVVPRFR